MRKAKNKNTTKQNKSQRKKRAVLVLNAIGIGVMIRFTIVANIPSSSPCEDL